MKYVAIIDTDEYKNFKFFEDGCGEYLVAKDKNAQPNEWIRLPFVKAEIVLNIPKEITNWDMIKIIFPNAEIVEEKEDAYKVFLDHTNPFSPVLTVFESWLNVPYKTESEDSLKIDCNKTKCESCTNHSYCDYEIQT